MQKKTRETRRGEDAHLHVVDAVDERLEVLLVAKHAALNVRHDLVPPACMPETGEEEEGGRGGGKGQRPGEGWVEGV